MSPSWSDDEILHEVLVVPRQAFVAVAGMEVIERPGWMQLVTPAFREGGLNEVSLAVLDPHEAEAVIDATLARYAALGLRFRWVVGPDSRPADLARRLALRGLRRSDARGMFRSTALPDEPLGGVDVEEVDATSVDEFSQVMGRGWSVAPSALIHYHRCALADPARRLRLFLARMQGEAVGAAGYAVAERDARSAYLMGAVVLPAFRGRGVYRALVETRLRHAAARGLPLATSHAREETSAPLLEHLGFRTACRLSVFSNG